MKRLSIFLVLLLGPAPALLAQPDERRARWEAGLAEHHRSKHRFFVQAGFAHIAEAELAGRDVRRLVLQQPYGGRRIPGVEVERHADGRVTLRFQFPQWSTDPVLVDRSGWDALTALDATVFAQPEYVAAPPPQSPPSPPPPPPSPCHGWSAALQAGMARTAFWSACGSLDTGARDYVISLIALAMGTKPDCPFDRGSPFNAFTTCFHLTDTLDDPTLEATYAVLVREYYEAPGSERLAEARRALNVPGLALGNQAWLDARAAIAQVKEIHDMRRERLRRLQQLAYGARDASEADRYRMRQAISNWSGFVQSQEANLADLLWQLASASN